MSKGRIENIVNQILDEKAKYDPILAGITKTRIILKGIPVLKYDSQSPKFDPNLEDDPNMIEKLLDLAKELDVTIK